ncbi:hypothetical protein GCM10023329_07510 [Streptomyces sanyensis]|uniref:Uncharacterized protein n=1 Tax=Streptomyces sanyensis TaxID=568869 RepID=A0ABP8ZRN5_9ACTN
MPIARAVVLAGDQIAFPVARDGPVVGLGGTVTDHHHVLDRTMLASVGLAARAAAGASGPQGSGKLAAEFTAALDVERLVDRLVGHVHLRPVGKPSAQSLADLLGTPPSGQTLLDEVPQLGVLADLPELGAGPAGIGAGLGRMRPVVPLAARIDGAVAVDLPADGGRAAAQLGRDGPDGGLLPQPVGDVDALLLAQVPRRDGLWRPHSMRGRHSPVGTRPAVPPFTAGSQVDPDDPAGFLVRVPQLHEAEVFLPLTPQLPGPLSLADLANLEVHRTP